MVYKIDITKIDPIDLEKLSKQILLFFLKYTNLAYVFSKNAANTLPKYRNYNLCLETMSIIKFEPLYNLFQNKLKVPQKYIANNLAKRFIQSSTSLAWVLILFTKKKYEFLCLCIDYKSLNLITKKNQHSLSFISKALDWVIGTKIFTNLDISNPSLKRK